MDKIVQFRNLGYAIPTSDNLMDSLLEKTVNDIKQGRIKTSETVKRVFRRMDPELFLSEEVEYLSELVLMYAETPEERKAVEAWTATLATRLTNDANAFINETATGVFQQARRMSLASEREIRKKEQYMNMQNQLHSAMKLKNYISKVRDCRKAMEELIHFTYARIQVAARNHLDPASVTESEAKAYLEWEAYELSEAAARDLLETVKRKAPPKRKKKKAKGRAPAKPKGKPVEKSETQKETASATRKVLPGQQNISLLRSLNQGRSSYRELPRVTKRWFTKDPEVIRTFCDTNAEGETIQRYRELEDSEIIEQRKRHYLPGLEKLLENSNHRGAYSFPTDRGYGVFAELVDESTSHYGIVYFGVGQNKTIYHRHFVPLEETGMGSEIFQDRAERRAVNDAGGEQWQSQQRFQFSDISEQRVLRLDFTGEEYFLRVYPLEAR